MTNPSQDKTDFSSSLPERYFSIPKEAPKEVNIDALLTALSRASSVVALLEESGADLKEGFLLDQMSVMEAINTVGGLIDQARQIAEHGIGVKKSDE